MGLALRLYVVSLLEGNIGLKVLQNDFAYQELFLDVQSFHEWTPLRLSSSYPPYFIGIISGRLQRCIC